LSRVDSKSSRSLVLTTPAVLLAFALPIAGYFWFIHQYGVNIIYYDQWSDIDLIGHFYSHTLSWNMLWMQHNESRMLFPNLIVLALARTTHFNIVDEEYLGAILLCGASGLIILAHKHRSPSTPWIYYAPVVLLMFSLIQGDTLFGFQIAWWLTLFALAATVFLLDRSPLNGAAFCTAMIAAMVGSFSSLQGLLIWPVGLVLLYFRGRPKSLLMLWVGSAVVTGSVYFYHFDFKAAGGNDAYMFAHPIAALKFFFFSVGDVVGVQIADTPGAGNNLVIAFGVLITAIAIWTVASAGLRRDQLDGVPVGVALICFGMLFALTITAGRVSFGLWEAGATRYTTFNLLIVVGCYMANLERRRAHGEPRWRHRKNRRGYSIGIVLVLGVVLLQVVFGTSNGLVYGGDWYRGQQVIADVTANIDRAPNAKVETALFPNPCCVLFVRRLAEVARRDRLSLFATHVYLDYRNEGLFPDPHSQ